MFDRIQVSKVEGKNKKNSNAKKGNFFLEVGRPRDRHSQRGDEGGGVRRTHQRALKEEAGEKEKREKKMLHGVKAQLG